MNIVNRLTLRHLKENKSRSVVTTLGICVSVAMITAVFVAGFSLMNLLGNLSILQSGNWHAAAEVGTQAFEKLKNDERIEKIGLAAEDKLGLVNKKDFILVSRADKELMNMLVQCKYEGRLPENDGEIIINRKYIDKYFPGTGLGGKITFLFPDDKPDSSEYTFEENDKKTYTVVGIMDGNEPAGTICFASTSDLAKSLNRSRASAYFTLKKLDFNSMKTIESIDDEYGLSGENASIRKNTDLLSSKFALSDDSFFLTTILPLCAICLVIIIIASVMLIYNAFGMSLSERVRYLGMLASVGATKKQKRMSVYFEGLLLGAIGIPVGIIAGFVGIAITLYFVGDKVISSGLLSEAAKAAGLKFTATVNPFIVVLIILFSALTIFISLYIPARKASRITPIDAIRQKDDFKLKAKKIRSSRLIRAIFGYEGELANKSLKRNRRKTNMITASIALSVVLFLCVNYFCQMLVQSNDYEKDVPYDITVGVSVKDRPKLEKMLTEIEEIDNSYNFSSMYLAYTEEDKKSPFADAENYTTQYKNLVKNRINVYLTAVDNDAFNRLCKDNKLNSDDYYDQKNLKCVLMNDLRRTNENSGIFNSSIIGKTCTNDFYEFVKGVSFTYEIGGIAKFDSDDYICSLNGKGSFSLYCPISEYLKVYDRLNKACLEKGSKEDIEHYELFQTGYGIKARNHSVVDEQLVSMLDEAGMSYSHANYAQSYQMINTLTFALQVFVYGFITLITMISIANIINTVSTGIMMRRKEFAMLKSVGTTPKGFNKMICLESFFYGAKALVFSMPISLLICYFMNVSIGSETMPFSPNLWTYLGCAGVVFAIVGISMYYSVRKLKDDSIVETLKTEIN